MQYRNAASGIALLIFIFLTVTSPLQPGARAAEADEAVPAPAKVFTPRTALAIYADLQGARQSAIWKAIADKAGPLAQQFQSLHASQLGSMNNVASVPGINETNVVEVAVSLEGGRTLNNLQSGQFDADSGFIVAARLAGTPDVESLIQELLGAIGKESPDLRSQIEKSRRRIGAAAFFDVPAEALGEQKPPFAVSSAIGPGKDGTIIALGRSEHVEAFLSGKTEGKLRDQRNDALTRRGQIWLYFPVPKDAAKSLGGGSDLNANPMLAGLVQGMDKVRDVNLSLKFGSSQVDLSLYLGCSDAAAAAQLAQVIQGFLGMVQLGAKKNPASMPPFVAKLKAGTEATVFRLTTAFTIRDFDLAFQNASRGAAAGPSRAPSQTPKPESAPLPASELPMVDVEFVQFTADAQESLRTAKMRVQNRSSKPVKDLKLTFIYSDQSGRKVGQWTRSHSSLTADNLIDGETTRVVDCLAFNVPPFTKKITVTVHEATFADGAKWSPAR
jgi:hypothetical protein